jgi:lipopolysaccharide/colanic/teichoic acid biosynthesis glycosyltransferase
MVGLAKSQHPVDENSDLLAGAVSRNEVAPPFEAVVSRLHSEALRKRLLRRRFKILTVLVDLLAVSLPLVAWSLLYLPAGTGITQAVLLTGTVCPAYLIVAFNSDAFRLRDAPSLSVQIGAAITSLLGSVGGLLLLIFLAKNSGISRVVVSGSIATSLLLLVLGRSLLNRLVARRVSNSQFATLCLYDGIRLVPNPTKTQIDAAKYGLAVDSSDAEMVERLATVCKEFDRLVVHCPPEKRLAWAFLMRSLSIPAEIVLPELDTLNPIGICKRSAGTSAVIGVGPMRWYERGLKRAFDLLVVGAALPLLVPVTLFVGMLIKLDSNGPMFFLQDRIGRDNRPFKIIKFRSMRTDMLDTDGVQSTERDDPRITKLGSFLRRTSLDELPQLYNVLLGEMSLVGPRPHAKLSRAGDRLFWEVDNAYWHRHSVKPGITGLAQVRGHRGNTFHENHLRDRLSADLEYVANWSLMGDVHILFRTFGVLTHSNAF